MKGAFTIAFVLACIATVSPGHAQTLKQQLVGTWILTNGMEKYPDKTLTPWETGNLTLTPDGHVTFFLIGKDRPKTDKNPRNPIAPVVAYYGTYTLDESAKTIFFHIDRGASPIFDKAERKQSITLNGDSLVTSGIPTQTPEGTMTPVNEWKRAK